MYVHGIWTPTRFVYSVMNLHHVCLPSTEQDKKKKGVITAEYIRKIGWYRILEVWQIEKRLSVWCSFWMHKVRYPLSPLGYGLVPVL